MEVPLEVAPDGTTSVEKSVSQRVQRLRCSLLRKELILFEGSQKPMGVSST